MDPSENPGDTERGVILGPWALAQASLWALPDLTRLGLWPCIGATPPPVPVSSWHGPLTCVWMSSWYLKFLSDSGRRVRGWCQRMRQCDMLQCTVTLGGGLYLSATRTRDPELRPPRCPRAQTGGFPRSPGSSGGCPGEHGRQPGAVFFGGTTCSRGSSVPTFLAQTFRRKRPILYFNVFIQIVLCIYLGTRSRDLGIYGLPLDGTG